MSASKAPLYRQLEPSRWDSPAFVAATDDAKLVYLRLATGPETTSLPGVVRVGPAALAEAMGWDVARCRAALAELASGGLAEVDERTRLVWLPAERRPPANPNVATSWRRLLEELPESDLRQRLADALGLVTAEAPKASIPAKRNGSANRSRSGSGDRSPNGSPNPMPNQEQEQEQEQEPPDARARDGAEPEVTPTQEPRPAAPPAPELRADPPSPADAPPPAPRNATAAEDLRWRYGDAMRAALGGPWGFPADRYALPALEAALAAHGPPGSSPAERSAWLERTLREWVASQGPAGAGYASGWSPAAFGKWLNAQRPKRGPARGPRYAQAPDPGATWTPAVVIGGGGS